MYSLKIHLRSKIITCNINRKNLRKLKRFLHVGWFSRNKGVVLDTDIGLIGLIRSEVEYVHIIESSGD